MKSKGRIGKISAIKKEYNSSMQTMQKGLAQKGFTRIPGTGVLKFPYKEIDGRYRTGLDPNAAYIKRIQDPTERELEMNRVTQLRDRLQEVLNLNLSPTSKFWNYALSKSPNDSEHVQPAKLMDGDNAYDLSDPWKELTFAWLRVHPTIASSFQAYERGEFPADTQFYVADEDIEAERTYKKKQLINKAISMLDAMTPTKMRKVARLLGLPISEDTKEEIVYNQIDNLLKQTEFKDGRYKGLNPVKIFTSFAEMEEKLLTIKDLVKQAVAHSIYRVKPNGKVFEGEMEVAKDEDDLVKYLIADEHQDELIILEQKLTGKKLASV